MGLLLLQATTLLDAPSASPHHIHDFTVLLDGRSSGRPKHGEKRKGRGGDIRGRVREKGAQKWKVGMG
jgi:hypothetical protein